jgi:hypothetical protein
MKPSIAQQTAFVLFAAAAAQVPNAWAQVYRWVDADGRVNYSNAAPSGAREVRRVDAPPPPAPPSSQSLDDQREQARRQDEASSQRWRERNAAYDQALAELRAALAALEDARREQAQGVDPLEGEWTGVARRPRGPIGGGPTAGPSAATSALARTGSGSAGATLAGAASGGSPGTPGDPGGGARNAAFTRVSDAYFDRQAGLERRVIDAETRVARAQDRINQLR